jgi:hypothetical protein
MIGGRKYINNLIAVKKPPVRVRYVHLTLKKEGLKVLVRAPSTYATLKTVIKSLNVQCVPFLKKSKKNHSIFCLNRARTSVLVALSHLK